MTKIGFIGAGNMATALIKGLLDRNVFNFSDIYISDINTQRCRDLANQFGINICVDNISLVQKADITVLSVKPQVIAEVLSDLKDAFKTDALIVSIAAGITVEKIAGFVGDLPIVRVMPNTPALIGSGVSGIYANKKASGQIEKIKKIFSSVGAVAVVADEKLMDIITAVSGSGPAYYFLMMETMITAAIELGIQPDMAAQLVLGTAKGAADLAIVSKDSPAQLRARVTSPGGTTEAAVNVFSTNNFSSIINQAIKAAKDKSIELSK
jgi:pyrroline-5-carboxylate reductase